MNKPFKFSFISTFLILELVLYILIVFVKTSLPINIISYMSILLCVIFMFVTFMFNKNKYTFTMLLAIVFTAIADFFLVLLFASNKPLAMISFSLAQISYMFVLLYFANNKTEKLWNLLVRAILFVILNVLAIIILKQNYSFLVFISLFYFSNLCINIVFAFFHCNKNLLFTIGLLLFFGCDIIIGLQFLSEMLSLDSSNIIFQIAHTSFNLAWFFYLPSQVLIVLSSVFNKKNNFNNLTNPKELKI
jgi:hypothetical protein